MEHDSNPAARKSLQEVLLLYYLISLILIIVDQKPFSYTTVNSREFGVAGEETLSTHFRDVLQEQKKKFIDYVERPSKYLPEPTEPLCLSKQSNIFKAGDA